MDRFSVDSTALFANGAISLSLSLSVLDEAEHRARGTQVLCFVIATVMLGRRAL
jgi:CRISPR/Cas system-associated endonuclease/helicase Cas3